MEPKGLLSYEGLKAISDAHGDSFYLFNKNLFKRNLRKFKSSFTDVYSNVKLGYSYKTNYIPEICKIAKSEGVLAEVVSGMEYKLARQLGYEGRDIIFNGPLKMKQELFNAFRNYSIVHFDSYREILYLKEYLAENPSQIVKCALRCNFDIGEEERSRFGFDAHSNEVLEVYEELFNLEGCLPIGIHCHFSTRHRSLDSYKLRTEKLIELSKQIFKGRNIEYIDIGGGFFGEMPLEVKSLFSHPVPTFKEYGNLVASLIKRNFPKENVSLVLEPGASVVANTMKFVCRVYSIKEINGRHVITLTGGIHNVRPTGTAGNIPFSVMNCSDDTSQVDNALIGGYTCMETDIIFTGYSGKLAEGDFLLFDNMGAYNIVFKPPFIKETPPVLGFDSDKGSYNILKRREELKDILMTYQF